MRTMLLILTLACASCATSKSAATRQPTTQPARRPIVIELRIVGESAATRASDDKLVLASLVVDVKPGQVFSGSAPFREGTLSAEGLLQTLPDGRFRVNIRYRNESASGKSGVQSTVELTRGEDFNLSGLMNGYGEDLVILRLQ